jgi:hypothetical protein
MLWHVFEKKTKMYVDLIFRDIRPSRASWRARVQSDLQLLRFRVPENLVDSIFNLIDTI